MCWERMTHENYSGESHIRAVPFMNRQDLRVDCYLAVLSRYKTQFPHAHFEIITRASGSALSPSWELLKEYKISGMPFATYAKRLFDEFFVNSTEIMLKIKDLQHIATSHTLFLVCYEKDPAKCHHSIIWAMVRGQSPDTIIEKIEKEGHCLG